MQVYPQISKIRCPLISTLTHPRWWWSPCRTLFSSQATKTTFQTSQFSKSKRGVLTGSRVTLLRSQGEQGTPRSRKIWLNQTPLKGGMNHSRRRTTLGSNQSWNCQIPIINRYLCMLTELYPRKPTQITLLTCNHGQDISSKCYSQTRVGLQGQLSIPISCLCQIGTHLFLKVTIQPDNSVSNSIIISEGPELPLPSVSQTRQAT